MHGQIAYVLRNIQLTSELIAVQAQHGQIDEVAELFGEFACKNQKGGMSAKHTNTCNSYAGTYNRTCEAIALQVEHLQIDEVAELLGQLSCNTQVNVSKHIIHVCWNTQLASELIGAQIEDGKLGEVPELLGQLSCKNVKMSANRQRMYAGT